MVMELVTLCEAERIGSFALDTALEKEFFDLFVTTSDIHGAGAA